MIRTRQDLIAALLQASELEHGLMLQYLFAAFTMKRRTDEGMTGAQHELSRAWTAAVLGIAREEMAHLGTVCNLLSAIGGPPRFGRPNFPQPAGAHYPFEMVLERYSATTLDRFIRFEIPKEEATRIAAATPRRDDVDVVPEPVEFAYVGELYRQIRAAFARLPERELFIGPKSAQEADAWSRRTSILRVQDRASALAAIDFIVFQGEGAEARHREGSHYETFVGLRRALDAHAPFDPARPVCRNPRTRQPADAPMPGTLITNPLTRDVANVFDAAYQIALLMLAQLYAFGGETLGQRAALRQASRQLMTTAIRPLGELLTELPVSRDPADGTAGPTFELHVPFALPTQPDNRWTLLFERFVLAQQAFAELGARMPRLAMAGETMALIAQNLKGSITAEQGL